MLLLIKEFDMVQSRGTGEKSAAYVALFCFKYRSTVALCSGPSWRDAFGEGCDGREPLIWGFVVDMVIRAFYGYEACIGQT